MKGRQYGKMNILVLNAGEQPHALMMTEHEMSGSTAKGCQQRLLSIEEEWAKGVSTLFCHKDVMDGRQGFFKPGASGKPDMFIPFTRNWQGQLGWFLPFVRMPEGASAAEPVAIKHAQRKLKHTLHDAKTWYA